MNYKIFIEYENSLLTNFCNTLYNLFLENNYDVSLLDNNISFSEKENIIKQSNKKNIIISNKVNDNDSIEIVYALRNTDKFAIILKDFLSKILNVSKYYQRRDSIETNNDYYKILRNINNNESIIIFYPPDSVNKLDIAEVVYQGIVNYLNEGNIYTVIKGDSLYSIARKFNITVNDLINANSLINNNLSIGQKLIIPMIDNSNSNQSTSNNTYTVKSGDSLYAIARKYNTTVDNIKKENNLTSNNLSVGQKLIIPMIDNSNSNQSTSNNTYTVKSGDSLYAIARKYNTTVDNIKRKNNLTSNNLSIGQKLIIPTNLNNQENNSSFTYTVKSGDSLYAIARKYNTTVDDIKRKNNLTNNNLSIGQSLIIP